MVKSSIGSTKIKPQSSWKLKIEMAKSSIRASYFELSDHISIEVDPQSYKRISGQKLKCMIT
jgi:hypothetical protein